MFVRASSLVLAALLFFAGGAVWGQDKYPERGIEVVIPIAPGGTQDLATRLLADIIPKYLGQPLIPINKPGAGGFLGGMAVAKAKPDGYTIGVFNNTQAIPEVLAKIRPASYSSKDFQPIANFSGWYVILCVKGDAPYKTFQEFVEYARKHPNELRFGHPGVGNSYWQLGLSLAKETGIKLKDIPFNGEAEYLTALLGNHIEVCVMTYGGSTRQHIQAKILRVLCTFEKNKLEELPDVPTIKSLGFNYDFGDYIIGALAPKATPKNIVVKLDEAIRKVTEDAEFKEKMKALNLPNWYLGTKDFENLVAKNIVIRTNFLKEKGFL